MTERPDTDPREPDVDETAPVEDTAAVSGSESAPSAGEAAGGAPAPAGGAEPEGTGELPAPEESPATAPDESAAPVIPPAPAPERAARGADASTAEPVAVRASARYVRTSARKARVVCDTIRGKSVTEARAILAFTPRAAAKPWSKLLESAVANAEHNHELVGEDLRILQVHADEGPTLKRFQPRAMGRATRIRKRTSHLTIVLSPKDVPAGTRRGARRKGGR